MKAISLWQPWATAVALEIKRIETRGWFTAYRGLIAIHAAKRWSGVQREFARDSRVVGLLPAELPFGAVVATVNLVECWPTAQMKPGDRELLFGDFRPGRFAWVLRDVCPLLKPVPYIGRQGFFDVPDELLRKAA